MTIPIKLLQKGLDASKHFMWREDKIWARYSNDKVDVGETLTRVTRTLSKSLPLKKRFRALSIGSSNEPQFRILQTAFQKGLYLLDIEKSALKVIQERIKRQETKNVYTVLADFRRIFFEADKTKKALAQRFHREKIDLITLQHSMYYSKRENWYKLFKNLYQHLLAKKGAIYSVLMAAKAKNLYTTTWLYNHFAGKFCNHENNQDLLAFAERLKGEKLFKKAEILTRTNHVQFFVNDFEKFMAVIWMILLYPNVHHYTLAQRKEIVEFCYRHFFKKRKPLIQSQDHLVVYRNLGVKGII